MSRPLRNIETISRPHAPLGATWMRACLLAMLLLCMVSWTRAMASFTALETEYSCAISRARSSLLRRDSWARSRRMASDARCVAERTAASSSALGWRGSG